MPLRLALLAALALSACDSVPSVASVERHPLTGEACSVEPVAGLRDCDATFARCGSDTDCEIRFGVAP